MFPVCPAVYKRLYISGISGEPPWWILIMPGQGIFHDFVDEMLRFWTISTQGKRSVISV